MLKPKKKGKRRKSKAKIKLFTPAEPASELPTVSASDAAVPTTEPGAMPDGVGGKTSESPTLAAEPEIAQVKGPGGVLEAAQPDSTAHSNQSAATDDGPDLTDLLGDGSRFDGTFA
jgi:hypothetical protein